MASRINLSKCMANSSSIARGCNADHSTGAESTAHMPNDTNTATTDPVVIAHSRRLAVVRSPLKCFLIALYCRGLVPAWAVRAAFFLFRLRSL